jgi:hypothetical protein
MSANATQAPTVRLLPRPPMKGAMRLVILLLLCSGCGLAHRSTRSDLRPLRAGPGFQVEESGYAIISDSSSWRAFARKYWRGSPADNLLPSVDFDSWTVVVVSVVREACTNQSTLLVGAAPLGDTLTMHFPPQMGGPCDQLTSKLEFWRVRKRFSHIVVSAGQPDRSDWPWITNDLNRD